MDNILLTINFFSKWYVKISLKFIYKRIKQSYHIVLSVDKIQKEKTRELQRKTDESQYFYQNLQCAIIEIWELSKKQETRGLLSNLR